MGLVKDLLASSQSDGIPEAFSSGLWYAKVAAPAPTTVGSPLFVTIPDIDPHIKWGPVRWMPRVLALPAVGDDALVVFDNRQQPWAVGIG